MWGKRHKEMGKWLHQVIRMNEHETGEQYIDDWNHRCALIKGYNKITYIDWMLGSKDTNISNKWVKNTTDVTKNKILTDMVKLVLHESVDFKSSGDSLNLHLPSMILIKQTRTKTRMTKMTGQWKSISL